MVGLVTDLTLGRNSVSVDGKPYGVASLDLTNYASTGPIISGPQRQPFTCQTESFKLPDGSTLGAPTEPDCGVATRIDYAYLPTGATLR